MIPSLFSIFTSIMYCFVEIYVSGHTPAGV